jgi:hypothetical protein
LLASEWQSSRKPTTTNTGEDVRGKGTLIHCRWECKLVQPLWKRVMEVHEKLNIARCQWLTPVILATQEAEIRRIMVQS